MSTDYFYLKESTNELIEIGNSYSFSESYEELLKKLKSYQKKELSTIELQEKLYNWCLKEFDCDTDDSFFQFLIVRFIPSIYNWIDKSTIMINEYQLSDKMEEILGDQYDEYCKNRFKYPSYEPVFKTVGSIYENTCPENGVIDLRTTFSQALIELKNGLSVYQKDKPDVIYKLKNKKLFCGEKELTSLPISDILSGNWIIKRR